MLSFIRRRLTFANAAIVVALVLAMSGGAYAASKYLITSTKQISPKVLKQLKGMIGQTGATGPQGPEGKTGKDGTNGTGTNGTNGKDGTNGTSATTETFVGKVHGCEEGGIIVKSASPEAVVCNGKQGKAGNPAEYPEVLPEGRSETGTWAVTISPAHLGGEPALPFIGFAQVSYPIPTATNKEPEPSNVEIIGEGEPTTANCKGRVNEPTAGEGFLCLYTEGEIPKKAGFLHEAQSYPMGADVIFALEKAEGYATGTWAMTPR
jgi:hypothetical protein